MLGWVIPRALLDLLAGKSVTALSVAVWSVEPSRLLLRPYRSVVSGLLMDDR
jgi:hypothetical protein